MNRLIVNVSLPRRIQVAILSKGDWFGLPSDPDQQQPRFGPPL